MDENRLRSAHYLGVTALIILLILSGGFISGELKKASQPPEYTGFHDIVINDFVDENFSCNGDLALGKALFSTNCQRCHLVDRKLTGPALKYVESRWSDTTNLYAWIKNSQKFLLTGDKYANDLFKQYNTIMPAFPELQDSDIASILCYIKATGNVYNRVVQ